jgi:hypothetical protein
MSPVQTKALNEDIIQYVTSKDIPTETPEYKHLENRIAESIALSTALDDDMASLLDWDLSRFLPSAPQDHPNECQQPTVTSTEATTPIPTPPSGMRKFFKRQSKK